MKWFKHFHNADSSHKLALLMENHGKSAYAEYWLLLELLCEKYKGDEQQIEVTEGELCRKLRRPFPKKMKTFLKALQNLSILDYKENEKTFKFETRILWELKQKDFARARKESKPEAIKSPLREKREEKREKNNILSGKPDSVAEIINLLNSKAGTKFKPKSANTVKLINARLKEGYEISDFEKVIDKKCKDWLPDPKMCAFVRPITLFGTKFESYLNEAEALDPEQKADQAISDYIASELGGFFDE